MKLVIQTQYKENYGAHDWDGKGECPQYWKFKGGETYVFSNIKPSEVQRIIADGIPTLTSLIESADDYAEEYITDWSFEDDAEVVCEEWHTPWELDHVDGKWIASRSTDRDDHWNNEVLKKIEYYYMVEGGSRESYSQKYELLNGEVVTYQQLADRQKEAA